MTSENCTRLMHGLNAGIEAPQTHSWIEGYTSKGERKGGEGEGDRERGREGGREGDPLQ